MYTRTYADDHSGILIPDSYGGTALSQPHTQQRQPDEDNGKNPWEEAQTMTSSEPAEPESTQASAEPTKLHMPAFLTNIFKNSNFGLQKIGTEEILIIAAAAFLLFSKDGDKECAIILLLILFLG